MSQSTDQTAHRCAELFEQGYCCSESVLQAVAESRGIQSKLIPGIATGLCGGIARSGGICGAVSGGVLAISMITGRSSPKASREENQRLVRTFLNQCEAQFSSTNCEQLIGCRLDTPEGQRFFSEHHLREKCAGFAREAARMAARLLDESDPSVTPH
ncbi:MAG: C-GCAxxG-C-C family protein [Verrucomicrobiota bacterium]|jgi:C_GCAxxG_C_C family probable redox protein